jgi:hypothetical protein
MKTTRIIQMVLLAWGLFLLPGAGAAIVQFFDPSQIATLVEAGTTFDTISSEGYLFTYTRDKLFTGGLGGGPIGRAERVSWPDGLEAQAVTEGPVLSKARITISRVDSEVFDIPAFTAKLPANTFGTGAHIEIMPQIGGEDAFNDPFMFSASGFAGSTFSFDRTTPAYLGNTTPLQGYDGYKIALFVDFAMTELTLEDQVVPEPTAGILSAAAAFTFVFRRRRSTASTAQREPA